MALSLPFLVATLQRIDGSANSPHNVSIGEERRTLIAPETRCNAHAVSLQVSVAAVFPERARSTVSNRSPPLL